MSVAEPTIILSSFLLQAGSGTIVIKTPCLLWKYEESTTDKEHDETGAYPKQWMYFTL